MDGEDGCGQISKHNLVTDEEVFSRATLEIVRTELAKQNIIATSADKHVVPVVRIRCTQKQVVAWSAVQRVSQSSTDQNVIAITTEQGDGVLDRQLGDEDVARIVTISDYLPG